MGTTDLFHAAFAVAMLGPFVLAAAGCGTAGEASEAPQVEVVDDASAQRVDVRVAGELFTSYVYADSIAVLKKPVLYPLISPAGTPITRGFPIDPREGERTDHPHHIGLWFNYGDVNGFDFWNNSDAISGERQGRMGTIRHRSVEVTESGTGEGRLEVRATWVAAGEVLLEESTRFVFHADADRRAVDRTTTLTALDERVDFHDNKEGVLGLRLTRALEMPSDEPVRLVDASGQETDVPVMDNEGVTGRYRNSEGVSGYPDVWGKRARWTALAGVVEGDSVTVVILDNPENVGFPTYWHARDYGLFAANPLGQAAFSDGSEELDFALEPGASTTFRHRVVIYTGQVPDERIEAEYDAFAAQAPGDGFPAIAYHRIDNAGVKLGQTDLADVDGDGDLDWVAGDASHSDSTIWWWEYRGPDDWMRHELGKGYTDVGGAMHDVDGDGDPDMLSGSILLLNPGRPDAPFEAHDVGTIHSHDTEFADVDGDGDIDALANSDASGLFWYEIPADPTRPWPEHPIASADEHEIHGGISPNAVGDIDGDGDPDVVTGRGWYENADGAGLDWSFHENIELGESHRYGIAVRTWVGDLDGDGDADVVQSEADNPDGRVAWFENDGSGRWTRHVIREEGGRQDFHGLAVADFDLDGDLDVFACGGPLSADGRFDNVIFENTAGANGTPMPEMWTEHLLVNKPCHEPEAADVDRDGDVDIVAKPWHTGDEHYFLRNTLVE